MSKLVVPGDASLPKIEQFKESASILNGIEFSIKLLLAFSFLPVEALPVNVTISSDVA